jgi:hypothetical protein
MQKNKNINQKGRPEKKKNTKKCREKKRFVRSIGKKNIKVIFFSRKKKS